MALTQHSPSHQDVEESLSIPAVVKFGARGIKKLRNRFQISASLVQTLNDTFLKLSRVKSLLFICGERYSNSKLTPFTFNRTHEVKVLLVITSFASFKTLAGKRWLLLLLIIHKRHL